MKTCTKCGRELAATTQFFGVHRQGRDGLRAECKDCRSVSGRRYYAEHREHVLERQRAYQEEHPDEVRAAKAAAARARYAMHPEDARQYQAEWRAAHLEQAHAAVARWDSTHADERRAYSRSRRALCPEAHAAAQRNRRARERSATGTHTHNDVKEQYERQHGRCYWCGVAVGDSYHVDHVMPLSLGGSNGPENLVIACAPCNRAKNASHPMDFAGVLC